MSAALKVTIKKLAPGDWAASIYPLVTHCAQCGEGMTVGTQLGTDECWGRSDVYFWFFCRRSCAEKGIRTDAPGKLVLKSAGSSYKLPVLVVDGQQYGPLDILPDGRGAAEAVACWNASGAPTAEESKLCTQFFKLGVGRYG